VTEIVREGRRLYFKGAPFSAKDTLKSAGAHWDPDVKAWWMGTSNRAEAEAVLDKITAQQASLVAAEASLPPISGPLVDVGGNTYPVRDQLRAIGGQWDAARKVWRVPESRLAHAQKLVANAPKDGKPFRYTRCKQCGARPGPRGWPRIYRNGICSDCYNDGDS
jgi:hypothetical protein